MQIDDENVYDYPAWRRDAYGWGLLVVLSGWALAGWWYPPDGGWSAGRVVGMALLLVGTHVPVVLPLHARRRRTFRSVRISQAGVRQTARNGDLVAIGWEEIERVEPLGWKERVRLGDVPGVRLAAGDRQIRVFRAIRGWGELRARVEREARERDIPFDAPA